MEQNGIINRNGSDPRSGGGSLFRVLCCSTILGAPGALPGNKPVEIVAEGSVAAETILVEQALDTAPEAHLVGMILDPDRPTHLLMPATPQNRDCCARQARHHNSQGP
jgi:hypothetical protein